MSDVPSVDVFREHWNSRRGGAWASFARSMKPNTPIDVSSMVDWSVASNKSALFRTAARKLGMKVSLRTIDGRVWACWLGDEE